MTHLINRLEFEITCPDETRAFQLRQDLSHTIYEQISELADRICSKHINDEEWIQIDKLEIDLGELNSESLSSGLKEKFLIEFEKKLTEKIAQIPIHKRENSKRLSKTEIIQFFLLNGTLPWWAVEDDVNLNVITRDIINIDPGNLKQFLFQNRLNKNMWVRIAYQFNDEVINLILLMFEELCKTRDIYTEWLDRIIKTGIKIDSHLFQEESIRKMVIKNSPEIFKSSKVFPQENSTGLFRIFKNFIFENFKGSKSEIEVQFNSVFFHEVNIVSGIEKKNNSETELSIPKQIFIADDFTVDTTEKYVVRYAGLVLLNPFLKAYFNKVGLLNGIEWVNKASQHKAIQLLRFLTTGLIETPEYAMVLEKIICGLSIHEPVQIDLPIDEKDMTEAELLLESVIEHWSALKNTSINGLRESFLKRDGILIHKENCWHLTIEQKTLDVLLDKIPWGYSTIHMPWNDYIIFVEW